MPLLLYINGQLADLEPGQVIAQTKQVNDLNSIDDRQASYTNKFRLPKTAVNLRIMEYLTVTGNTSVVPYQKNKCSLYSESGECFVYKGQAVITDGGSHYEVVVYDGIIDLYKAVENKNLSKVDLEDANHDKTVAAVKNSMYGPYSGYPAYTYILADYNGNTGYSPETPRRVNIDYLVPAINVKFIWDKIFEESEMEYHGSVFLTESFKDLWLTFPKGVSTADDETELFLSSDYIFQNKSFHENWRSYWLQWTNTDINALDPDTTPRHLKVVETGTYRIEVSGTIHTTHPTVLCHGKNGQFYDQSMQVPVEGFCVVQSGQEFSASAIVQLAANDTVCLILRETHSSFRFYEGSALEVRIVNVKPNSFDFANALSGLSIKDFLTEIVHRFGLTIFKRKDSQDYDFLTLQEHLQTSAVADWSSRFGRKLSEKYIYGNYAQNNWLRYNYNDTQADHNDGNIDVANQNLPESRDVIKSKIYSPEKEMVTFLGKPSHMYKLWDKELVEEPEPGEEPFEYKSLDKRYYLMKRQIVVDQPTITLASDALEQSINTGVYNIESFYKLGFDDIVKDYYQPLRQILDNALMVTAEFFLSDADVANFDFRKLYYVEQLSAYFIINRIINYIPGKPVKCEMVRVQNQVPAETVLPAITITNFTHVSVFVFDTIMLQFETNYDPGSLVLQYKQVNATNWITLQGISSSPVNVSVSSLPSGAYHFRIHDTANTISSNTEHAAL